MGMDCPPARLTECPGTGGDAFDGDRIAARLYRAVVAYHDFHLACPTMAGGFSNRSADSMAILSLLLPTGRTNMRVLIAWPRIRRFHSAANFAIHGLPACCLAIADDVKSGGFFVSALIPRPPDPMIRQGWPSRCRVWLRRFWLRWRGDRRSVPVHFAVGRGKPHQ